MLQQQRGRAAPVHAIGDGQRDFRRGLIGAEFVTGHPRQLAVQQAEQRHHAGTVLSAYPPGLELGGHPARAEETEVQVLRRHLLMQLPDRLVILRAGGRIVRVVPSASSA